MVFNPGIHVNRASCISCLQGGKTNQTIQILHLLFNPDNTFFKIDLAPFQAKAFIDSTTVMHPGIQYLLIIEGQASRDNYPRNYELSYERAYSLKKFWEKGDKEGGPIMFTDKDCEVLICGSGDGKQSGTGLMRETNERLNQRFLIHILPKPGVIEQVTKQ